MGIRDDDEYKLNVEDEEEEADEEDEYKMPSKKPKSAGIAWEDEDVLSLVVENTGINFQHVTEHTGSEAAVVAQVEGKIHVGRTVRSRPQDAGAGVPRRTVGTHQYGVELRGDPLHLGGHDPLNHDTGGLLKAASAFVGSDRPRLRFFSIVRRGRSSYHQELGLLHLLSPFPPQSCPRPPASPGLTAEHVPRPACGSPCPPGHPRQ